MALFGKNRNEGGDDGARSASGTASPAASNTQAKATGAATVPPAGPPAKHSASQPGAGRNDRKSNSQSRGTDVATIGKSIIFKGELSGDEDLELDGNIEGNIHLPNHELTIGPHGKVKAEVKAKAVQVIGHVSGNVHATERVEVQATGIVEGDISAPRLLIQEGAVVNGSIQMTAAAGGAAAKPPAPEVRKTA